jgi:hypothetical protein
MGGKNPIENEKDYGCDRTPFSWFFIRLKCPQVFFLASSIRWMEEETQKGLEDTWVLKKTIKTIKMAFRHIRSVFIFNGW